MFTVTLYGLLRRTNQASTFVPERATTKRQKASISLGTEVSGCDWFSHFSVPEKGWNSGYIHVPQYSYRCYSCLASVAIRALHG